MARIRTIKPELWMSHQVMNCTRDARLLFIGLITQADDEGRGSADPRRLKASIFPGDEDITFDAIRRMLDELSTNALATTYDGGEHGLIYAMPTWRHHQSLDRPRPSRYPPPNQSVTPQADILRRQLDEASTKDREGSKGSNRTEPVEPVDNSGKPSFSRRRAS